MQCQHIEFLGRQVIPILSYGNGEKPTPAVVDEKCRFIRPEAESERAAPRAGSQPLGLPLGVPIRLVRRTKLQLFSHTKILVTARRGGLLTIDPRTKLAAKHSIRTPNGIAEVRGNMPFEILITNFSSKEVQLDREQIVAKGMRTSQTLLEMAPQVSREFVSTILAVPVFD